MCDGVGKKEGGGNVEELPKDDPKTPDIDESKEPKKEEGAPGLPLPGAEGEPPPKAKL